MAKIIGQSVGIGGLNVTADVSVVQYLLNCVPVSHGGPTQELSITGVLDHDTLRAIQRMHLANRKDPTSRLDPNSSALRWLSQFDPFPNEALNLAFAKSGGKETAGSSSDNWGAKTASSPSQGIKFGAPIVGQVGRLKIAGDLAFSGRRADGKSGTTAGSGAKTGETTWANGATKQGTPTGRGRNQKPRPAFVRSIDYFESGNTGSTSGGGKTGGDSSSSGGGSGKTGA